MRTPDEVAAIVQLRALEWDKGRIAGALNCNCAARTPDTRVAAHARADGVALAGECSILGVSSSMAMNGITWSAR
jgi:hypothetical protein